MPPPLDIGNTVLVNTLAHTGGVLVFGVFILFFLKDRHGRAYSGLLPVAAALLALIWNLGSVAALAAEGREPATSLILAGSFFALSMLPAVLLHTFLGGRVRTIWGAGYAVSTIAACLHLSELFHPSGSSHSNAILAITLGFGVLTPAGATMAAPRGGRAAHGGPRLLGSMCLVLLVISFVHLSSAHDRGLWPGEIALHHIGIPLALVVLLQNHRFVMLDAFLTVLANGLLAALFTVGAVAVEARVRLLDWSSQSGFSQAAAIICLSVLLIVFAACQRLVRTALDRFAFGRGDLAGSLKTIRQLAAAPLDEMEFLDRAAKAVANFARTEQVEVCPVDANLAPMAPAPAGDGLRATGSVGSWAEAAVPLRFSRGDARLVLLGRRPGGRRYLSHAFDALARMASAIVDGVERLREREMQTLVAEAEFRALQSQINPHFLFNALNAVYGTIPKDAREARKAVLNLSEMLRYCLRSDDALAPLSKELDVVRAYLELEALRLGERLETEIAVPGDVSEVRVPALSIQPLAENAVKHGVANKPGRGKVTVAVERELSIVRIRVIDTGGAYPATASPGGGMGLANVRRRLQLCFGPGYELHIGSAGGETVAWFEVPVETHPGRAPAAATGDAARPA